MSRKPGSRQPAGTPRPAAADTADLFEAPATARPRPTVRLADTDAPEPFGKARPRAAARLADTDKAEPFGDGAPAVTGRAASGGRRARTKGGTAHPPSGAADPEREAGETPGRRAPRPSGERTARPPRASGRSRAVSPWRAAWDARALERQLLLLCLLVVALGFALIQGARLAEGRAFRMTDLLPLLIHGAGLALMHLTLTATRFRGDQLLPAILGMLAGLGLLAQSRMGAFDAGTAATLLHALFPAGLLILLTLALGLARGRYDALASELWIWIWGGASLALLAAVLILGQRYRGAVYGLGLTTPTELLKVTTVLFMAAFIDRRAPALRDWGQRAVPLPPLRALAPLLAFWLTLAALLLLQRDLGLAIILSLTLLTLLFAGTGRLGYPLLGGLLAAAAGTLAPRLFSHGQSRLQAWLDPFQDPTGNSWQILQGLSGMYAGGLWGEGFGRGNPEYTPIAQSDFIYAVLGEELGFIGTLLTLGVFLALLVRGLQIADRAGSSFGRLLALGLTAALAIQILLNIGGVTKAIPLTGLTLPFISHGGSSLLTGFVSLGLLLAISAGPAEDRRGSAGGRRAPRSSSPTRRSAPLPPDPSVPARPSRASSRRSAPAPDG